MIFILEVAMATYHTKAKTKVLQYLEEHSDEQFTVKALQEQLSDVPQSTIYRIIEQLLEEHKIRKFAENCYQYFGCQNCNSHLHIKCTDCGKLVHLEGEESRRIARVLSDREFLLDESTMLLGKCKDCRSAADENSKPEEI